MLVSRKREKDETLCEREDLMDGGRWKVAGEGQRYDV